MKVTFEVSEIRAYREAQSFHEAITLILAETDPRSRAKFPRLTTASWRGGWKKRISSPVHLCAIISSRAPRWRAMAVVSSPLTHASLSSLVESTRARNADFASLTSSTDRIPSIPRCSGILACEWVEVIWRRTRRRQMLASAVEIFASIKHRWARARKFWEKESKGGAPFLKRKDRLRSNSRATRRKISFSS